MCIQMRQVPQNRRPHFLLLFVRMRWLLAKVRCYGGFKGCLLWMVLSPMEVA
jgi:hypothetical protein